MMRTLDFYVMMQMTRITVVLTISLLLLVVAASVLGQSLDSQELAYLSVQQRIEREGHIRLLDVRRGFSMSITKTRFASISSRPQWSSDGDSLFFAGNDGRSAEVYLLDLKSGDLKQLTDFDDNNLQEIIEVAPSPDGQRVAFLRSDSFDNQIYLMNVDGSERRQLTGARGIIYSSLDWSPDSKKLIYNASAQFGAGPELWLLNVADAELEFTNLLEDVDEMGALQARWLPDGNHIGMLGVPLDPSLSEPYLLLDVVTKEATPLLEDGSFVRRAAWSQDGARLVYAVIIEETDQQLEYMTLLLLELDSGQTTYIMDIQPRAAVADILWSADESMVAVTVFPRDSSAYISILQLPDGEVVQSSNRVDRSSNIEFGPAWRP